MRWEVFSSSWTSIYFMLTVSISYYVAFWYRASHTTYKIEMEKEKFLLLKIHWDRLDVEPQLKGPRDTGNQQKREIRAADESSFLHRNIGVYLESGLTIIYNKIGHGINQLVKIWTLLQTRVFDCPLPRSEFLVQRGKSHKCWIYLIKTLRRDSPYTYGYLK